MITRFAAAVLAALMAPAVAAAPAFAQASVERPIVIELYTSQGCSSCPPANAFLNKLAHAPGILALSFHVDYWDYLGWKDSFALRANSDRQRAYARALSLRYVYTPQIFVDGYAEAPGSKTAAVLALIDRARAEPHTDVVVTLDPGDGHPHVAIAAGHPSGGFASVVQVLFDPERISEIRGGENSGRTLVHRNVVRDLRVIGIWRGGAVNIPLALDEDFPGLRVAVLLHAGDSGRIVGAATIERSALYAAAR